MNWLTVIGLSAAGGAIVTVVAFCGDVFAWQQTRRTAHLKKKKLPTLREYVDPWPDFVVLLTRIALGVIAGVVFRSQVTTALAAVAVGASAPALLTQLGNARQAKPENGGGGPPGNGTDPAAVPSIEMAEPPKSEKG